MSQSDEYTTVKELIEFLQKLPQDAIVLYCPTEVMGVYPGSPIAQPEIDKPFSYNDCIEETGLYLVGEQSVGIDQIDDLNDEGRSKIKYFGIA